MDFLLALDFDLGLFWPNIFFFNYFSTLLSYSTSFYGFFYYFIFFCYFECFYRFYMISL
jgi:hypothetical protein